VVLDIEVAFAKEEGEQDRIDILLYDMQSQVLRFFEAKDFKNPDLRSKSTPRVIEQIKRYQEQIRSHEPKLKKEYGLYIDRINQLFNGKIEQSKNIEEEVSLLIFGFDGLQKKGGIEDQILKNPEYKNVKIYAKGDPNGLDAETLWKNAK
jgi:hypothetical protein